MSSVMATAFISQPATSAKRRQDPRRQFVMLITRREVPEIEFLLGSTPEVTFQITIY
jgi:hypothetical protein